MAAMTDEEYQMYQRYGPNYREYMRFGYGRNQARARNQFNPSGGFYHTDPPQVRKVVENIMGASAPEQNSSYLSDYLQEYEKTRQRMLQLEDLMNQNQFQYSQPNMSFEDFYNQYYGNYGGGGGGDEGSNGVTEVNAQISQTPEFEGNVPVPNMPGWTEWNGFNAMVQVNWVNTKTGERLTVPHAGFNPPSGEGWVKEEFKSEPLDPKKLNRPDATIMGNTGTTATQPFIIQPAAQQTTAAYAQMAQNNAVTAATSSANNDRGGDRIVAAPAASTMSDKFIARYERAEATGNDNPRVRDESSPVVAPVKTVAPVKKVVKPASSFRQY